MTTGSTIFSFSSRSIAAATRGSADSGKTMRRARADARARTPSTNSLTRASGGLEPDLERLGDLRMHELRDVAAEARNLAHQARADVGRVERRHHEDRLESRRQVTVHQGHLVLVLEIADRAQASDEQRRVHLLR